MEPWLFYALLSAVSAAFVSIFGKVGLQGIDSNVATAVRSIIMAVFLVGVVFVQGNLSHLPDMLNDKKGLLFVALSGIAGATSWLFYFLALKYGPVSKVAPIDKLSVVFAVILAVILFGEKVSLVHGIAIAMIAAGGLILAIW
ncbi:EamA family transporter [Mitsuokella sp.]|uniref:EamA family transporter n=1 Tax=unclassified Mitsuokella TaxID=2637239 RepID=UPI000EEE5773|nr:EamA family transporter [Oscillospiraceae bacterium]